MAQAVSDIFTLDDQRQLDELQARQRAAQVKASEEAAAARREQLAPFLAAMASPALDELIESAKTVLPTMNYNDPLMMQLPALISLLDLLKGFAADASAPALAISMPGAAGTET